ncbi:hypothetical protein [Ornithinimicrobium cryptoxanthini]|uniref:hypothetical protein n=1 Tax=Ornithinimicrobium cryptoxanthini TaxID=2934161 RepID=UPI0021182E79|nr:hypothetical protein [Ornithinimicrobium cryptoxanthini]
MITSIALSGGTIGLSGGSSTYLDGWTIALLVTGLVAAGVCAVAGLRGHGPGRITLGITAVLQAVVAVVFGVYLARSLGGDSPVGPAWELWAYLVTVLMVPAVAWIWTRTDSSRWGTFVLALAGFVVAVMGARSAQIWYGVGVV